MCKIVGCTQEQIPREPGELRVWDMNAGKWLHEFKGDHQNTVCCVAFSHDGNRLASSGYDKKVIVREFQDVQKRFLLQGHTDQRVISLAFSPKDRFLASGGWDRTVRLWDLKTQQQTRIFTAHPGPVNGLAFSRDTQRLFTSSGEIGGDMGTVHIWNLETEEFVDWQGHQGEVRSILFSPEQQLLVSAGSDGKVLFRKIDDKKATRNSFQIANPITSIACSSDEKYLAIAGLDGTVRLWNWITKKLDADSPIVGHVRRT